MLKKKKKAVRINNINDLTKTRNAKMQNHSKAKIEPRAVAQCKNVYVERERLLLPLVMSDEQFYAYVLFRVHPTNCTNLTGIPWSRKKKNKNT